MGIMTNVFKNIYQFYCDNIHRDWLIDTITKDTLFWALLCLQGQNYLVYKRGREMKTNVAVVCAMEFADWLGQSHPRVKDTSTPAQDCERDTKWKCAITDNVLYLHNNSKFSKHVIVFQMKECRVSSKFNYECRHNDTCNL